MCFFSFFVIPILYYQNACYGCEKAENQTWSNFFFTDESFGGKRDFHNVRSYLFFNVWKFWATILDSLCNDLKSWWRAIVMWLWTPSRYISEYTAEPKTSNPGDELTQLIWGRHMQWKQLPGQHNCILASVFEFLPLAYICLNAVVLNEVRVSNAFWEKCSALVNPNRSLFKHKTTNTIMQIFMTRRRWKLRNFECYVI